MSGASPGCGILYISDERSTTILGRDAQNLMNRLREHPPRRRSEWDEAEAEQVEPGSFPRISHALRGGRRLRFSIHDFRHSSLVRDPPEALVHTPELAFRARLAGVVLPDGGDAVSFVEKETPLGSGARGVRRLVAPQRCLVSSLLRGARVVLWVRGHSRTLADDTGYQGPLLPCLEERRWSLIPYTVWVTIASALNYYVWVLNA